MDARKTAARGVGALIILAAICGMARAELSSTWTLASDYDFRGTSNSAGDPVLQASVDYEAANGFFVGTWASTFDYGREYDGSIELDLYAGYTHEWSETRSWSAWLTTYTFPDSNASIEIESSYEASFELFIDHFQAVQTYAPDFAAAGVGALYTEANYTWTLPRDFHLRAHAGYSWGEYWDDADLGGGALADFSLKLSRGVGPFTLAGIITGTDASGERRVTGGPFRNDVRLVFSIETTFPWDH